MTIILVSGIALAASVALLAEIMIRKQAKRNGARRRPMVSAVIERGSVK